MEFFFFLFFFFLLCVLSCIFHISMPETIICTVNLFLALGIFFRHASDAELENTCVAGAVYAKCLLIDSVDSCQSDRKICFTDTRLGSIKSPSGRFWYDTKHEICIQILRGATPIKL